MAGRNGQAGITRDGHALIRLFNNLHLWQLFAPFFDNLHRAVSRAVIHDDDFHTVDMLIYKAGKELIEKSFTVINGNHHA
ncbi:Uncharacterised protein [Enterobacter cloacae]|nr:Uncharacterised protein [Enterobacter cloacae]